jgi:hypothetical protein
MYLKKIYNKVKICKSYMSTDLIIADEIIEEMVGCPCYGMKL